MIEQKTSPNAQGFRSAQRLKLAVIRPIDFIVRRSALLALARRGALLTHRYPSTPKAAQSVLGSQWVRARRKRSTLGLAKRRKIY